MTGTAKSLARYLSRYGFNEPRDAVGRVDLLDVRPNAPVINISFAILVCFASLKFSQSFFPSLFALSDSQFSS